MEITRNQENYYIMSAIYQALNEYYNGKKEMPFHIDESVANMLDVPLFENTSDHLQNMLIESLNNFGKVRLFFTPHLRKWNFSSLPLLTQAILIMSYVHYFIVEKPDKRVIINIAVKLAKEYIDEVQAKFINAILDEALNEPR